MFPFNFCKLRKESALVKNISACDASVMHCRQFTILWEIRIDDASERGARNSAIHQLPTGLRYQGHWKVIHLKRGDDDDVFLITHDVKS